MVEVSRLVACLDIKIIDLEFSLIMPKDTITMIEDHMISLYLNANGIKLTKKYLYLFDVFLLAQSIVSYPCYFSTGIYEFLLQIYQSNDNISNEFMEFFIIYRLLKNEPSDSHFWNDYLDARYDTINNLILNTKAVSLGSVYESHLTRITEIISEVVRINLHHNTHENTASPSSVVEMIIVDNVEQSSEPTNKKVRHNGSTPTNDPSDNIYSDIENTVYEDILNSIVKDIAVNTSCENATEKDIAVNTSCENAIKADDEVFSELRKKELINDDIANTCVVN